MSALNQDAITRLVTVSFVDLNTATPNLLYIIPQGKSCVVTHMVLRTASISMTTASYSVGWNSASYNDVVANATHTELTGSTLYSVIPAKAGAKVGTSGQSLFLLANTLQGAAATITVEIFGYLL
jgi:hypothetical protein